MLTDILPVRLTRARTMEGRHVKSEAVLTAREKDIDMVSQYPIAGSTTKLRPG